ncbi:hypothetical protein pipiens_008336 [Culex pipiens pipiens]|uniref:Uncharacterized protein n=1 Tax=Culex pipiens pipiens TaxID=38569 RepID=A0ABD1DLM3_CULPP
MGDADDVRAYVEREPSVGSGSASGEDINAEKLHPALAIKKTDVMFAILNIFSRHKLTNVALTDLLLLINLIVGFNSLPTDYKKFCDFFCNQAQDFTREFVCDHWPDGSVDIVAAVTPARLQIIRTGQVFYSRVSFELPMSCLDDSRMRSPVDDAIVAAARLPLDSAAVSENKSLSEQWCKLSETQKKPPIDERPPLWPSTAKTC